MKMNRLLKNALRIERHAYAPELNGLRLKSGAFIQAKYINTFGDIRALYKPTSQLIKRVCVSVKHASDDHTCCDKVYLFGAKDYDRLKYSLMLIKVRHNLPDAVIKVQSIITVNV